MPAIQQWLSQQTVLLTGGTGFLGQALIFKLVQCGCSKVYVLIRPKKGRTAEQRLSDILKRYTFDSLRGGMDIESRVTAIHCDTDSDDGLGISKQHVDVINKEVTLVFHGAASVKFDDSLKVAVLTNMRMTWQVMELAREMTSLKLVAYISTAFANCEYMEKGIEERLYEAKMDWRKVIQAVETLPDDALNSLEAKLLGASPNTYIFTKHLTETLVTEYGATLPTVIVRPAIVISSFKEPQPGWITSLSSPVAIIAASGKGVLRLYKGPPDTPRAYVPIDIVVNGTICIAWRTVTDPTDEQVPVYNTNYRPWSAERLKQGCFASTDTHPMKDGLWYRRFHFVQNGYAYLILHLLVHVLPGLVVDGLLKLNGKKPMLTRLYRKMYMAFHLLTPFLNHADNFRTDKYEEAVMRRVPQDERDVFYLDTESPDDPELVQDYIKKCNVGLRALMGEPTHISPGEIAHNNRLYYLDTALNYAFYGTVLWYFPYQLTLSYATAFCSSLIGLFVISDESYDQF